MNALRRSLLVVAGALFALSTFHSVSSTAERVSLSGFADDPRLAPVKQVQRRAMLSRQQAKLARAREAEKAKKKGRTLKRGAIARGPRVEAVAPPEGTKASRAFETLRASAALAPNVRANNTAGDQPDHGQAEASMAALGNNILIAWNDGSGFDLPSGDIQGVGYSTNGGASFTDFGIPPKPAGYTWNSDPVITVNEKTGTFYYCALIDGAGVNGIGLVSATFSGANLVWGTPRIAIEDLNSSISFDKQWIAADSTSDSVYIAYSNFNDASGSEIDMIRSANGVTWTAAQKLSSASGDGLVHGVRVAVGPNGEVYACWSEIGPIDVDFFRIRRSDNAGSSFGAEFTLPSYYANFGTGAPGFNRERGITFPSLAVDRTTTANRGRLYVAWNECINWYDDISNPPTAVAESEPNNNSGVADPFTLGQRLTGAISSATDQDWFSFSATQGQDVVMRLFPSAGMDLSWVLFCSDGFTRLALSNLGIGREAYLVFTVPKNGTYFIRPAPFQGSSNGNYTIYTKASVPSGAERSRDHRDVFVSVSANRGQTWGTPVRVNQDPGYFDNWLPEVAVGGNGLPYVIWYDWRNDVNCGGSSDVWLARSDNAGGAWTEVGAVTDAQTAWTSTLSNIAPNQGDYLYLFANQTAVYPVWYDGRGGDVDTYVSAIPLAVTPTGVSLVSTEALPDQVTLTWSAPGMDGKTAHVYRRQSGEAWAVLATMTVDSSDRVTYVDTGVTAGESYFYRLGVVDGTETFSGETEVVVPTGIDFALRAVGPNPVSSELWVTFALPTAQHATLGLFDIAGRQVISRDLGSQAGVRREEILRGENVPNGLYVVQLKQGDKIVSTRVSVVR